MIKPPNKGSLGDTRPGRPHSKGQSHMSRRRNYKLIIDPEIHGKQQEKQYRFDGHNAGDAPIEPRDPRKKVHFTLSHEVADLPVPRFKYDNNYVGKMPERRILLSNLNDNVNKDFLLDVCKKYGTVETVSVYSHPQSKRHLGLASVGFKTSQMALEAVGCLNGRSIMGLVVLAQLDPTGLLAKQHVDYLVNPNSAPRPSALHKQATTTASVSSVLSGSSSLISRMEVNKSGQSKNLSYSQKFSMMLAGNPEIEPISPSPPHDDTDTKSDSKLPLSVVSPPPPPPPQPPPSITPPLPPGSPPTGLALTSVSTETRQPIALAEDPPPLPPPMPPPLPSEKPQQSPPVTVNGSLSPSIHKVTNREQESERNVSVTSPHRKTLSEEICQLSNSSGYNSTTNGVGTPSSGDDQRAGKTNRESVSSLPKQNDITTATTAAATPTTTNIKEDDREEQSGDEDMEVSSGSDSELPEFKPSHPPLPPLPPLPSEPPPLSLHPLLHCPPLPSEPPPPLPPLPPKSLPVPTSLPSLPVPPCTLPSLPSSHMSHLPVRMPFLPLPPRPVYFAPPIMPPNAGFVRHPPPIINQTLPPRMRFGEQSYRPRNFNHYSSRNSPIVDSRHQKPNRHVARSSRFMEIELKDKERMRKRHTTWSMLEEGKSQLDIVLDKVSEALKLDMLSVLKRDVTKQLERCIIDSVESWWEKKIKEERQEEETEETDVKSELGSLSLRVGGMSIKVDKHGLVTYERLPKMPSFLKRSLPVQPERLPGMARRQDSRDKGVKRSLTVNEDEDEDDDEPSAKRRIEDVWSDEDTSDHTGSDSESERSVSASSESGEDSGSEFSEEGMEESESESDDERGPNVEEYGNTRRRSTIESGLVRDVSDGLTTKLPVETSQMPSVIDAPSVMTMPSVVATSSVIDSPAGVATSSVIDSPAGVATSSVIDVSSAVEVTQSTVTMDTTVSHHVPTLQPVPVPSSSFFVPGLTLALPSLSSLPPLLPPSSSMVLVIPTAHMTSRQQPIVPSDRRHREEEESKGRADSGDREASSRGREIHAVELLDSREKDISSQEIEVSNREKYGEATAIVENDTDVITVHEPAVDESTVYSGKVKEDQANHIISPPSPKPQYNHRTAEEDTRICHQFFKELDDEDRKMMRAAFSQLQEEKDPNVENTQWSYHPPFPQSSDFMFDEWTGGAYKRHETGCARCEGYYKISHIEKRRYLKRGNTSDKEQGSQQESEKARHLSRVNRVQFRRVAAEFGTATSLISLNQLDIRKKMLKFARSGIHGWGLYALEHIAADEMVIEYVGEVVRNEVADRREKQYEQKGMGSSYMFRVDQEYVIDATHRGNFARFINHCCEPNCTAKVITVGCQKRIVIYSKRDIHVNEEITYDYKFPLEEDKIHCLCGAPGCRGSLN